MGRVSSSIGKCARARAEARKVMPDAPDAPVDSGTRTLALVVSLLSCAVSVAAIVFVVRSLPNAVPE